MIWPSNGRPKAKGSMMTDDSMMTVWVRKGLNQHFTIYTPPCKMTMTITLSAPEGGKYYLNNQIPN